MSPTIFREGPFRFHFYTKEEDRMHVHVRCAGREAKLWLEPDVVVCSNDGLSPRELARALAIARENVDEFAKTWHLWHPHRRR